LSEKLLRRYKKETNNGNTRNPPPDIAAGAQTGGNGFSASPQCGSRDFLIIFAL
jgi:hypothetical protein